MEYRVTINGITADVRYADADIEEIFLPLLRQLNALYEEKQRRILVLLAAPPGAGKSTLLDMLCRLCAAHPELRPLTAIGMDGFHRYQQYLLTHTAERDGQQVPMVRIKGAPVTFDLPLLTQRMARIAAGEVIGWPVYDRLLHDPVEDAVTVDGDIVLLEGNYLLLEEDGWKELRRFADYTARITADPALLRRRLIDRRMATGVEAAPAAEFVDRSDMYNVRLCLERTGTADLTLHLTDDGRYTVTG